MYSDIENVNILTALMVAHGIRHVVVCPGSRNAPLVHNFTVCPDLNCYRVTDERSAGFYALGLCQAHPCSPVAVCVTSGTALLNLFPAVAEAFYQHLPLVVISADRPQAWIEQLDGQTLQQPNVFGKFVSRSVDLPEIPKDDSGIDHEWLRTQRWYCNRLVNEALSMVGASRLSYRPIHINIPISEPLFSFNTKELPQERVTYYQESATMVDEQLVRQLAERIRKVRRPMIAIGQYPHLTIADATIGRTFEAHGSVLYEALAGPLGGKQFDEVLYHHHDDESYRPDFLLYGGDTIVSKRLRKFLREGDKEVWEISEDGDIHDTFQGVDRVIHGNLRMILQQLAALLGDTPSENLSDDYLKGWQQAMRRQRILCDQYQPSFSQMYVVKLFEELFQSSQESDNGHSVVHYANSSVIRLANIYARHQVYCNRGVNGIEGSLSTAAGFSLDTTENVFVVIGDLSFFYDSNALWNESLKGNLRILLLNNGGGGIFHQLPVAEKSPEAIPSVAGYHHATAKGLCESYDMIYYSARDEKELKQTMQQFFSQKTDRPVLLEVFTDKDVDSRMVKEYYTM